MTKKFKKHRRYSLHVTISTLFITLIIVFGVVLTWLNYNKTSEILLNSADSAFDQINREIALDFGGIRKSVNQTVHFLSLSPIIHAEPYDERIESLKLLSTALNNDPNMSAIQFGYPNGDYFIIRPINSEYVRLQFKSPEDAAYIVDNITGISEDERYLSRFFFDRELNEISRNKPLKTRYDPRVRPWYKAAMDSPDTASTEPYLFYFFQKVGVTLALNSHRDGAVVAADVTLDQLSKTLLRAKMTPNTEIVVLGKKGNALIYTDIGRLVVETGDENFRIAQLSELGSPVLDFLSKDLKIESQTLNFHFDLQNWLGSVRELKIPGSGSFYVLMVSPEKELLEKAIHIRWQGLVITAIIIIAAIPIVWLFARKISNPLLRLAKEAGIISRFDFSNPIATHSLIEEVEDLAGAMRMMKKAISQFLTLIHSLSGEPDFDSLLQLVTRETMNIGHADGAVTYLFNEKNNRLEPGFLHIEADGDSDIRDIPAISLNESNDLVKAINQNKSSLIEINPTRNQYLSALTKKMNADAIDLICLPLRNRQDEIIGVLCLLYRKKRKNQHNRDQISFVRALSGFAAVSLESRHLLMMQKALLDSFIKLIAGAIDSKSPYTGGHCQRVPELSRLLARAACDSNEHPFDRFNLDEKQWEALNIASWLHDCGKVTTPEYVVDKSTKLETIYDRIHEIRMRVEVLKRDAEIRYWRQIAEGGERQPLRRELDEKLKELDDDFAFIAECNVGGESMEAEKIQRLREIGEYAWTRTLDDTLGVSWEEGRRKPKVPLPAREKLLADKPDHLIERAAGERIPEHNPWGFKLDAPRYKYNRGELYNLEVAKGTLTEEERYMINDHIVQTIIMLEKLPYPSHLADIPEIAGGHHEKMDGTGYPKRLKGADMPLAARIMAIADIFEALTASDRPYKKPKPLSEAIQIMARMVKDRHIDADLFRLFLTAGVYLEYARKHLDPDQIDAVDIQQYLDMADSPEC
ncbi:MAG: HD domain-containing phosphohydrolase [Gammaproteobacteria bacterium]